MMAGASGQPAGRWPQQQGAGRVCAAAGEGETKPQPCRSPPLAGCWLNDALELEPGACSSGSSDLPPRRPPQHDVVPHAPTSAC